MPKVLIAVADGSEEIELVTAISVLRRADIDVVVASVMPDRTITALQGLQLTADGHIEYCQHKPWDMVVLSGGVPGADHLAQSQALKTLIDAQIHNEKWLAAMSAAPAVVLASKGFLPGATATCHPSFRFLLESHHWHFMNEPVVTSRHLISCQGPASAIAFALQLVTVLQGEVKAQEVAQTLGYTANNLKVL